MGLDDGRSRRARLPGWPWALIRGLAADADLLAYRVWVGLGAGDGEHARRPRDHDVGAVEGDDLGAPEGRGEAEEEDRPRR